MPEVVVSVTDNADDGFIYEAGPTFDTASNEITVASSSPSDQTRNGFFRLASVGIPNGATIDTAVISVESVNQDDMNATVTAAAGDEPASPTSIAEYLALTDTEASVDWAGDDLGLDPINSPDVSSIVQEKVNEASWSSGDSMMFLLKGKVAAFKRFAVGRAGSQTWSPFTLTVNYTEAASGSSIPAIMHHRRLARN